MTSLPPLADLSLLDPITNLSTSLPYPATTRTATTTISNTPTTATLTSFSDKLLLTISQHGRLAQWFSVPLAVENPSVGEMDGFGGFLGGGDSAGRGGEGFGDGLDGEEGDDGMGWLLVPQNRFTARTLLGAGGEREVWGGLVARCVAGLVVRRDGQEGRILILGLGLVGIKVASSTSGFGEEEERERREVFLRVMELVSQVL